MLLFMTGRTAKPSKPNNRTFPRPGLLSPLGPFCTRTLMHNPRLHSCIYFYEELYRGLDIKYHLVNHLYWEDSDYLKRNGNFTTTHISEADCRLSQRSLSHLNVFPQASLGKRFEKSLGASSALLPNKNLCWTQ